MKKIALVLALVLTFALVLTGCQPTNRLDAIKKAGKIVMLTNAAFPPFEYIGEGGAVVGVDAEVAQAIADDLGVKLEIVDMNFDLIVDSVKSGKGDIGVAGMTIKPERLEEVDFSNEYVQSSQYVIIKSGSGVTADALDGLTIAVQETTTGDFYATDDIAAKEVLRFKSGVEAAAALQSGKCDAVIIDELPAKALAANSGGALEVLPDELTQESYAIAVQKGQAELLAAINASIDRLIADGTIDALIVKHMALA